MAQTPEAELEMLQGFKEQLEGERDAITQEIGGLESRIEELTRMIEEGVPPSSAPYFGPMPFRGPAPYGPAPQPEQERLMLEQQAEALEQHIEAIKKRLEELRRGG